MFIIDFKQIEMNSVTWWGNKSEYLSKSSLMLFAATKTVTQMWLIKLSTHTYFQLYNCFTIFDAELDYSGCG